MDKETGPSTPAHRFDSDYHQGAIGMIKENGAVVKCPKCGSTNVIREHPFDYWKTCKDCKHQFMTGVHN